MPGSSPRSPRELMSSRVRQDDCPDGADRSQTISSGRLYTRDQQEKYGLCRCYTESERDQKAAIEKGVELLAMNANELADTMHSASQKLLNENIDVTGWLVWFVEHYPESVELSKKADADFWEKFR